MKDYKTIRAEINDFYNNKKNLSEIKRLEEALKEAENYLNDPEIKDELRFVHGVNNSRNVGLLFQRFFAEIKAGARNAR